MATPAEDDQHRRQQIPVLYVRGTNYEVGFNIGRTFRSLIEEFFNNYRDFERHTLHLYYESSEGEKAYEEALGVCRARFPQYVRELEGIADGARIPFHYLFLLHIEELLPTRNNKDDMELHRYQNVPFHADEGDKGCTSLICNTEDEILLGHTEDALNEVTNTCYIISAEILSEDRETLTEKFTSFTYPGQLPGGTMGFNHRGVVHSMNSIYPAHTFSNRTPHLFLTRAILGARSLDDVLNILRDEGSGAGTGFNLNVIFARRDGIDGAYGIEVSPSQDGKPESEVFVQEIAKGESYAHCNKYLQCSSPERLWLGSSSTERHETIDMFPKPYTKDVLKQILSTEYKDERAKHSIFKRALTSDQAYSTAAVGIFDVKGKTWSVYTHPPAFSEPVAVVSMEFIR